MKTTLLLALLAVGLSPRLVAQGTSLRYSPPASSLVAPSELHLFRPNDETSGSLHFGSAFSQGADYRWELGIAGAALLGLAGLVAANAACSPDTTSDSCVGPVIGTAAVGSLVGGVLGLFIGAGIEKPSRPPSVPTSPSH